MKIGITYNLRTDVENIRPEHLLIDDAFEEFDTEETIDAIADVLEKNGHAVIKLGWGKAAIGYLLSDEIEFVFNLCEGYWGRNREAVMPALLEMLDIPYSGSDPLALSLALDKIMAKKVAEQNGIKTPGFCVIRQLQDVEVADVGLKYPLFVKPAWEGSSKGIESGSKVYNKAGLRDRAGYLLKNYFNQPVLAEEYIKGREFTIGVLGNENPYILGVMEISSSRPCGDFFYSKEIKRQWQAKVIYECPPKASAPLMARIEAVALEAFKAFGCRDIARVDVRVDSSDNVYFLEINLLAGLSPAYSDIVIMARKMGWTYEGLISAIFNHSLSRCNLANLTPDEKI